MARPAKSKGAELYGRVLFKVGLPYQTATMILIAYRHGPRPAAVGGHRFQGRDDSRCSRQRQRGIGASA
jgi:hypothetical protein